MNAPLRVGPLNVLHVSQPVGVGVPDYVAGLVRDQVARGWRVVVASPPEERPLRGAVLAAGGIHVEWRAARHPGRSLAAEVAQLRRIVRLASPDLIHLHSSVAGLAGRLLLRGRLPTIFQPHGWSFHAVEGALRSIAVGWERLAATWTDEIICVSGGERMVGESVGIRVRWRVIKNGVDLQAFSEAGPDERARAREQLGIPPQAPTVVCVGRLSYAKGQDILIEAWPAVLEAVPEARLFLVGDGPDSDRLGRSAGAGVALVGHQDNVPAWLAAADVVALPSRWEGMSLAMLEAMARGRSVVSTEVSGAREAIGDSAGAVVARTRCQFAGALVERLRDPALAAKEGACARRTVEAAHDARKTADEVSRAYREVLNGRRAQYVVGGIQ
jgi:glycosyltransferase involved in cell wall biosynthesis